MTQAPGAAPHPPGAPVIPGVRIEGLLGRGGFAKVYAGVQSRLQRPVAVKVDSRQLDDERNRRRFFREVSAASRISGHPHVVSLIDAGVLPDGRPFMVMERCDRNLSDYTTNGPLAPADAVRIVEAVSSALGAAHQAGVLHRDVKPGNILIDAYGTPRLSDFGIAAILREEQDASVTLEALTPAFAPPEAFGMAEPTTRGDVWSMGAVLLALITGRGPRQDASGQALSLPVIMETLGHHVDTGDPRIPAVLRPVIDKAMHPDPAQRYRDGMALTADLAAVGRQLGQGDVAISGPAATTLLRPPSPPSPPAPKPRVGRALGLLTLGAVLGAAGTGGALWAMGQLTPRVLPVASASATNSSASGGASSAAASPSVNESGIPYSDDMPYALGTCLEGTEDGQGVATTTETECSDDSWVVFAGGTATASGDTSQEVLSSDPQVAAACSSDNAQRAGLDLSQSFTIKVIGPNPTEWEAGQRGFSCVFAPE